MKWRCIIAVASALGALSASPDAIVSGTEFSSEALRAQQLDADANPGMLWVDEGERLWTDSAGTNGKTCATCHAQAATTMRGVAARYPMFNLATTSLVNLEGRINQCRTQHQHAQAFPYESDALLGLTAFVAHQSLGMPIQVDTHGPAAPFYAAGAAFFHRRQGQMNLSCANCHDDHVGRKLRGDTISHGVPTGYPVYRLEWQTLGSLHRRLRACSLGVRAVQFDFGSPEYLALELYLAERAEGLAIETPAIRR
ncbi:MAG: sulfur oxidation c-type cytochrome SoxA [Gammaproteobacteria bacterium]|nr:sulfur oxidation c-type cytochrome SoxA [Gammaproteobacteria bacterium]